jgi:hypothetical protein
MGSQAKPSSGQSFLKKGLKSGKARKRIAIASGIQISIAIL